MKHNQFSPNWPWYCSKLIGQDWQVKYSNGGEIVKAGFEGWFETSEEAKEFCIKLERGDIREKSDVLKIDLRDTKPFIVQKIKDICENFSDLKVFNDLLNYSADILERYSEEYQQYMKLKEKFEGTDGTR